MFSYNVVSRWAQLISFLNCLQDVKTLMDSDLKK